MEIKVEECEPKFVLTKELQMLERALYIDDKALDSELNFSLWADINKVRAQANIATTRYYGR